MSKRVTLKYLNDTLDASVDLGKGDNYCPPYQTILDRWKFTNYLFYINQSGTDSYSLNLLGNDVVPMAYEITSIDRDNNDVSWTSYETASWLHSERYLSTIPPYNFLHRILADDNPSTEEERTALVILTQAGSNFRNTFNVTQYKLVPKANVAFTIRGDPFIQSYGGYMIFRGPYDYLRETRVNINNSHITATIDQPPTYWGILSGIGPYQSRGYIEIAMSCSGCQTTEPGYFTTVSAVNITPSTSGSYIRFTLGDAGSSWSYVGTLSYRFNGESIIILIRAGSPVIPD